MDAGGALLLLTLGFVVGLSGALIPGPLLLYTINESLQHGKWTGFRVILGHAVVEVGIFLLLILGLLGFMAEPLFVKAVSLLGGGALIWMALLSLKGLKEEVKTQPKKTTHGVIVGGIIFTLFNPSFPVWWATAGTRLLLEGAQAMGILGMILVLIGHWGADFGWFILVSMTTSKSSGTLIEKGWYKTIRTMLAGLLLLIGTYFLSTAL